MSSEVRCVITRRMFRASCQLVVPGHVPWERIIQSWGCLFHMMNSGMKKNRQAAFNLRGLFLWAWQKEKVHKKSKGCFSIINAPRDCWLLNCLDKLVPPRTHTPVLIWTLRGPLYLLCGRSLSHWLMRWHPGLTTTADVSVFLCEGVCLWEVTPKWCQTRVDYIFHWSVLIPHW